MSALPVVEFELPFAYPSLNEFKGENRWKYKKRRAQMRSAVLLALNAELPSAVLELVHIEVDRYSAGTTDWDNAYGGLKPLIDCLVVPSPRNPDGLGLFLNDNPKAMPRPPAIRQLKAKKGQGRTVVRIYAANDDKFKNDNND